MKKILTLAGLAVLTAGANAQLIVANDQSGITTLYYIDVTSGVATGLFTTSADAYQKAWGMAADDENQKLYWNNANTLFTCSYEDLRNGNAAGISQVSMSYGTSNTVNYIALAWDPVNDRLLGTRNIATEAVYNINPVTGVAEILWNHPATYDWGGLDCDPVNGDLYGLTDQPLGTRGLYLITETAQTPVILGYPGAESDIDGLAIGGGKAYYVTDGPNNLQASFYVYNIGTGLQEGVLPSPFAGAGTFSAAAWAPSLMSTQALTGTLNLSDTVGAFAFPRSIAYVVKQGGNPVANGSISCNGAASAFSLDVPTSVVGAVTIELNGSSFLRRISGANLTGANQAIGSITMQNGDVNNSGEVDAVDIDDVIANFGFLGNDPTDVDVNGEVDAVDIDIVIANFGGLDD